MTRTIHLDPRADPAPKSDVTDTGADEMEENLPGLGSLEEFGLVAPGRPNRWNVRSVVPSGWSWISTSPRDRWNSPVPPLTMPTVGSGNVGRASTDKRPR